MSTTGKPARLPEVKTELTPFSTPGDEFFGTVPPDHLALENIATALFIRPDVYYHPCKLARAAGLLLMGIVNPSGARDRLAIGNLRRANIHFHLVRAL